MHETTYKYLIGTHRERDAKRRDESDAEADKMASME
jgi:hypothetical protein